MVPLSISEYKVICALYGCWFEGGMKLGDELPGVLGELGGDGWHVVASGERHRFLHESDYGLRPTTNVEALERTFEVLVLRRDGLDAEDDGSSGAV